MRLHPSCWSCCPQLIHLDSCWAIGLLWWLSGEEFNCQNQKIPWRRKWQPTPVFLPGKSHGQRSLAGYSPWGSKRLRHNLVTKQKQQLWVHGILTAPQAGFALVSCLYLHVLFFVFFFKALLNLLQLCFCFMFWFLVFGCEACEILAPQTGIKPPTPALEGEVLTTGPPRKSHTISAIWNSHLSPLCPSHSVRIKKMLILQLTVIIQIPGLPLLSSGCLLLLSHFSRVRLCATP